MRRCSIFWRKALVVLVVCGLAENCTPSNKSSSSDSSILGGDLSGTPSWAVHVVSFPGAGKAEDGGGVVLGPHLVATSNHQIEAVLRAHAATPEQFLYIRQGHGTESLVYHAAYVIIPRRLEASQSISEMKPSNDVAFIVTKDAFPSVDGQGKSGYGVIVAPSFPPEGKKDCSFRISSLPALPDVGPDEEGPRRSLTLCLTPKNYAASYAYEGYLQSEALLFRRISFLTQQSIQQIVDEASENGQLQFVKHGFPLLGSLDSNNCEGQLTRAGMICGGDSGWPVYHNDSLNVVGLFSKTLVAWECARNVIANSVAYSIEVTAELALYQPIVDSLNKNCGASVSYEDCLSAVRHLF